MFELIMKAIMECEERQERTQEVAEARRTAKGPTNNGHNYIIYAIDNDDGDGCS